MIPIGVIHSPYRDHGDVPIQGRFKPDVEAYAELGSEYIAGLKDLAGFSHAILVYHFHLSDKDSVMGKPYLENEEHGIFAIRSPHRPNHIGMTVVEIQRVEEGRLYFKNVDMLDGTPLLDIKPYVPQFDCIDSDRCRDGWLGRHFADGKVPERARDKTANDGT
jgi:tRNA-Thr(GGU) m(6)t(6)A37 methyltransferase TsaA